MRICSLCYGAVLTKGANTTSLAKHLKDHHADPFNCETLMTAPVLTSPNTLAQQTVDGNSVVLLMAHQLS